MANMNNEKITYVDADDLSAAATEIWNQAKNKFATKQEATVATVATCESIVDELT